MVSGSDMHGTPITVTAQQEGKTPEEVAMHYHKINSKSIEDMGISFDLFSHTHTEEHAEAALWILDTLDKACLLYTSPSPRDGLLSRMPSSA